MTPKLDRTVILLSLCCLALAAVIVHQMEGLNTQPAGSTIGAVTAYTPAAVLLHVPKARQESDYTAIDQKPLFFASRKPVPKKVKAKLKAPPVKRPKFKILGTITDADQHIALIQLDKKAGVKPYRQGDKIHDWTIATITPLYLVLKFKDVEARYTLSTYPSLPLGNSQPKLEEAEKAILTEKIGIEALKSKP